MYEVIAEKGFDLNHTKKYKLSIQVSLDGFSFSIIHPGKNRLLALQNYPAKISSEKFLGKRFSEWTGKNQILSKKYAEIKILFYTNKFTLIPAEIYTKKKGDDIFRFIFGNQSAGEIKDCYLENIPGHLYFNIPTDLEQALENTFPGYELLHPIAVLDMKIKSRLKKEKNSLILHFYKKSFSLLLYDGKKIQLANDFPFTHPNDVLFYTISILKQYHPVNDEVCLLVTGDIKSGDDLHKVLKKYFSDLDFLLPETDYDQDTFSESLHHHIILL